MIDKPSCLDIEKLLNILCECVYQKETLIKIYWIFLIFWEIHIHILLSC